MAKISSEYVRDSSVRFSTKNAWAKWARRRYPNNGVKGLMADFGLTEGLAKGILYAQASQTGIDQILDHPRGGFGLGLEILAIRTGVSLEQFLASERERLDAEHKRAIESNRRAAALAGDLGSFRRLAGERPVRVAGQPDGGLGCGDD